MKKPYYRRGSVGLVGILALALAVIIAGYFYFKGKAQPAPPQQPTPPVAQPVSSVVKHLAVALNAQNNSGETGSAVFTDEAGKTRVALAIGTATSTGSLPQPAHVHIGSCKELGGIAYPLTALQSGASETLLEVSIDELLKKLPLAINVHKSSEEANVYVSCADVKAPVAMDTDTAAAMAQQPPSKDGKMKKMSKAGPGTALKGVTFDYSGDLADVTGGTTLLGITTGGLSSGSARAVFAKGAYRLEATFKNLPDPSGTDFYEGWIVRKAVNDSNNVLIPFDFISTGKATKTGDAYVNTYTSGADLTDHTFYVLTLETDDGNHAPSGHVMEGMLARAEQQVKTATTTPKR